MLGFLSTLISPFARSAVSAESDGTMTSGEVQKAIKTEEKDGFLTFQTAFENSDAAQPRSAFALQPLAADEGHAAGESASFEQFDEASEEETPSDYLDDDHEDSRDDAWQPDEGAPDAIRANHGDTQDDVPSASQIAGAAPLSPLSERALAQDSSQLLAGDQNSDAGRGRLANDGAHGASLASASIDGIRVQSALLQKPANDPRAALLLQAQAVPIQKVAHLQDQTALSNEPDLRIRPDQPLSELHALSPTTSEQVQKGMREIVGLVTDGEVLPDARNTAKTGDLLTASPTTTDMTRSAIPIARDPAVAPFIGGGIGNTDGERILTSVQDSVMSGDFGPVSSSSTEPRVVSMAGGGAPQLARYVAIQLSDAVIKGGERQIDLSLNPTELGRVRITLTPGEGGMVVSVSAERAETLDLMRRHADVLDQEFRDLGYGGTEFTFSREQDGARNDGLAEGDERASIGAVLGSDAVKDTVRTTLAVTVDRLDIRL